MDFEPPSTNRYKNDCGGWQAFSLRENTHPQAQSVYRILAGQIEIRVSF